MQSKYVHSEMTRTLQCAKSCKSGRECGSEIFKFLVDNILCTPEEHCLITFKDGINGLKK